MCVTVIALLITIAACIKIYSKLTHGICKCSRHLVGKVVIVTGANTGIGFETAKDLADRGARVILACRNETKALEACKRIKESTGNTDVHYRQLDLSTLKSVREFAQNIFDTEKRLDILINNAGNLGFGKEMSEDGILMGMQINHFGPFLLTNLLLPILKKSAPSRIVNVASMVHSSGRIDTDNLNLDGVTIGTSDRIYCDSKLCNVLMTVELSRRLSGTGVTANALHPGVIETELSDKNKGFLIRSLVKIMILYGKTVWEGAQTSIYLAVSPEVKEVSGKYFSDCKEKTTSKTAQDLVLARKLWEKSEEMVKLN